MLQSQYFNEKQYLSTKTITEKYIIADTPVLYTLYNTLQLSVTYSRANQAYIQPPKGYACFMADVLASASLYNLIIKSWIYYYEYGKAVRIIAQ